MTTVAGTAAPPGRHAATAAGIAAITGRNLRRLVRVPTLLVFATVQPVLFVLLFSYAFGGAIHVPGVTRYIDYLLPGIVVLAIGFGASQTGVAIGVGAAIGFRFHAGPAAALAAAALAVATGLAFSLLNLLLGLVVRDPESAGLAGLFPVIILFFTSSALVPVATMPGWLQAFAKANPITVITGALRALCLGGPAARPTIEAAAWIAALLAVTVPAAITSYRHATSI